MTVTVQILFKEKATKNTILAPSQMANGEIYMFC